MGMMFDIAVIGAGPVGLFSLFEAGMLGLKCCIIEALEHIGGQCSALYAQKPIYDIPGYPKILAHELVDNLMKQASPFQHEIFCHQQVINVVKNEQGEFEITTSTGKKILTKTVLIAAGGGAFGPNRPPLDGLEHFEGKSVFYMVSQPSFFRHKRVVIAGGGDSALDWAILLSEIADKVYLVHRRAKFRAAPESAKKIEELAQNKKIELIIPYQLHSITGEDGHLTSVMVEDLEGNIIALEADYLLPFFGLSMDLGPIAKWGINVDKRHITVDNATMETNISGIFAIGDIAIYPGKLKLILTGFAEAALACHSAYNMVHPDIPLHFEYSTTKGIPS